MENLQKQFYEACELVNIQAITTRTAAKIMSVVMGMGNNEQLIYNEKCFTDIEYIKRHFNIEGGKRPDEKFVKMFQEYAHDIQSHDFIPQWASKLFSERYNIKLYR